MDRATWTKSVLKVFDFFRLEKLPSDSQINLWFEMVKHIPNMAIDSILTAIFQNSDGLPRNLPKAFLEQSHQVPQQFKKKEYDKTEDLSFPVSLLHQGLSVLESNGMNAFIGFANQVYMPSNDRERVINKHNVIKSSVKFEIPEVGIRTNQKVNRPAIQKYDDDQIPF
jgi:hypothetical protein